MHGLGKKKDGSSLSGSFLVPVYLPNPLSKPLLSITSDLLIVMKGTDQVTEVRIQTHKITETQFALSKFIMRKWFLMHVINNCADAL